MDWNRPYLHKMERTYSWPFGSGIFFQAVLQSDRNEICFKPQFQAFKRKPAHKFWHWCKDCTKLFRTFNCYHNFTNLRSYLPVGTGGSDGGSSRGTSSNLFRQSENVIKSASCIKLRQTNLHFHGHWITHEIKTNQWPKSDLSKKTSPETTQVRHFGTIFWCRWPDLNRYAFKGEGF